MTAYGADNAMWKGGRTVASNGYVLIRVGVGHPLADVRGYAYEHRVVAAEALGRPLLPAEQVHHRNGIKTDNRPENLDVVSGIAEHRLLHRQRDDLRRPGESNPLLVCGCGCGATFVKYDQQGRPRRVVPGHKTHKEGT
jgi:hypothetical protein